MIDLRYLKKLIDMIDASSIDSVELTSEKGMKIRIAKSPTQRAGVSMAGPLSLPAAMPAPQPEGRTTPAAGVSTTASESAAPEPSARATSLLEVKSPMVGTFYQSPEPGGKAYVVAGDRVQKGMTLCIIEAMKIMNEIESEYAGLVREILVQDAQPVEYGQVLFRIDPNG